MIILIRGTQGLRVREGDNSRGHSDRVAVFEDEGRGHEPGHAGGLWKLEKAGNVSSPRASRKAGSPADTLALAQ